MTFDSAGTLDRAVTFDLFGTLVAAERPDDPAEAVAAGLRERGVPVPDDWRDAYGERHVDAPEGAEVSLPAHVLCALESRGVGASASAVREATVAAFDADVRLRAGAAEAVAAAAGRSSAGSQTSSDHAADRGPVGLLSNCSVPGLVPRALDRAGLDRAAFDAAVTSVGCGWRKPHPRAFDSVAGELGVEAGSLLHVGDDPAADGGIEALGGRFVDVGETDLRALAARLREDGPLGGESPCR